MGILESLKKHRDITSEEDAENDDDKFKIY